MSKRLLLSILLAAASLAAQDPPARAGRLSYISGSVSFQPSGVSDWVAATVNRPLTTGDQLFADEGARAEVHVPGAAFRLGSRTAFEFLNLDDRNVQVRFSEGVLNVRVRRMEGALEIDTPNLAFTIDRPGAYRFETYPDSYETRVTVTNGEGGITSNSGSFSVRAGQEAVVSGQDGAQYNVYAASGYDDFDRWARTRDEREDRFQSSRYVSPGIVGYEDLDDYGAWQSTPDYGAMWIPRSVPAGWAPYHYGHWAWVDPWGWSWVDDAPWGFAPFHYGRWAFVQGRWGWLPPPVAVAPVYAPALVAWFEGRRGGFQVSLGFGGGDVGWFPLGPRDVYLPAYQATPAYVTRINTTNTTVINNVQVTNVYNNYVRTGTIPTNTYANVWVPGAALVAPQAVIAGARPVQQAARSIPAAQVAAIRTASGSPRVTPQTAAVLGRTGAGQSVVARPAVAVVNRPVVAKAAPPARPAPFAQRQALLEKNAGRPIPLQQQRQLSQSAPGANPARVRMVTQTRPVTPSVVNTPAPRPGQAARGTVVQKPSALPPATADQAGRPQPGVPQAPQRGPAQATREQPRIQPQPARPAEPPSAQRPAPRPPERGPAQATREQPRVQPQPARPAEPPSAQRPAQRPPERGPAQATREQPRVQPQPARPVEPPSAQRPAARPPERGPAQATHEQPRVQPQPARPAEPPSAQRPAQRPPERGPAQATHEQPRVQPQPARPAEPPSAQRPAPRPPERGPAQATRERPAPPHRGSSEPPKREERPPL
jgi:hypothetical protein